MRTAVALIRYTFSGLNPRARVLPTPAISASVASDVGIPTLGTNESAESEITSVWSMVRMADSFTFPTSVPESNARRGRSMSVGLHTMSARPKSPASRSCSTVAAAGTVRVTRSTAESRSARSGGSWMSSACALSCTSDTLPSATEALY